MTYDNNYFPLWKIRMKYKPKKRYFLHAFSIFITNNFWKRKTFLNIILPSFWEFREGIPRRLYTFVFIKNHNFRSFLFHDIWKHLMLIDKGGRQLKSVLFLDMSLCSDDSDPLLLNLFRKQKKKDIFFIYTYFVRTCIYADRGDNTEKWF